MDDALLVAMSHSPANIQEKPWPLLGFDGKIDQIQTHRLFPRAAFQAPLAAGTPDEDTTHRLGGSAEELGAVLPIAARITDQHLIGLMHLGRRFPGSRDCASGPEQSVIWRRVRRLRESATAGQASAATVLPKVEKVGTASTPSRTG